MTQGFVFGYQGGRHVLQDHVAGMQAAPSGEKGREAAQMGVDQSFRPSLGNIGQLCQGDGQKIGGEGNRLTVEVAS